jgi:hypothetical protein
MNHALGILGINRGQSSLRSNNLFIIPSTMSLDLGNAEIFQCIQDQLALPALACAGENERLTVVAAVVLYFSVDCAVDLTFDRAKAIVAPLIYSKTHIIRFLTKTAYDNKNFIRLANLR